MITLGSLVFSNPDWLWPAVAFAALGLVFLIVGYARSPLRGGPRLLAFALKLTGLILLALCLLEPLWTGESPKKGANDLVVLADNSRGLSVKGPNGADTAGEAMARVIRGADGELPAWLETLGDTFRLQTYTFDARLKRSADFSELNFTGDASALLTGLRSLRARFDRRPLAGMLVFTDGNATDADLLEEVLSELRANAAGSGRPAPIFPVVAGADLAGGKDVALGAVTAAQSPFEDAPVTITAEVSARGLADAEAVVIVGNERGEELARETVKLGPAGDGGKPLAVRIQVPVARPGVSFFDVVAIESGRAAAWNDPAKLAKESGELTQENNRRLVAVDRGQGPFRILYVGGRPNWEYKYLRRSVESDSEIDLVSLIRIAKREPKFEWRGRTGESSNPLFRGFQSEIPEETQRYDEPVLMRLNTADEAELRDGFPKSEAELFGAYRAIILDDIEAEFFTQEQLNLMDRFVGTRGGTLLMLGGQESFQPGGWNNTPVGGILPVYLDRIGRGGPAHGATFNLTREGWLEPWVRLQAKQEEEEKRLAFMPEFFAINQVQAIKPGASVFATVTDSEQRQHPALAVQRYGGGRTAALMIADVWRWGMKDDLVRQDMEKMWRQMLRWLVVDVPDRIHLETRADTEGANPVTRFSVRVRDEAFRPQDDASVKLEIRPALMGQAAPPEPPLPDAAIKPGVEAPEKAAAPRPTSSPDTPPLAEIFAEPSLEDAGLFEAAFYPPQSGGYRARAVVRDGEGKELGETETGWALNPAAEEFRSLEPNRDLLETLAKETGGRVLTLAEVPAFVETLQALEAPVTETWTRPLWHAPWVFLLALACFAGEWLIRRRQGVL
ncbi:MAG: hypothetical protein JNK37_07135 [Verrucomicrobiales bacterium]|nr:hypothetical protein [Verrucomicrobiales bacterium]